MHPTIDPARLGDNPSAGGYAAIHGTSLYFEVYGKGEPLLLLHGNGGSMSTFSAQLVDFAKHFQVLCLDSRCHGKSGERSGPILDTIHYRQLADDAEALLRQRNLGPTRVVGWSDGGVVGLLLALQAPDLVAALAISGVNLVSDATAFEQEMLDAVEAVVADPATPPWDRALNLMMRDEPNLAFEHLSAISCPTLVMAGDRDLIRTEHTVAISKSIPGSELCIFPDSDHGFFQADPELFNRVVVRFLLR